MLTGTVHDNTTQKETANAMLGLGSIVAPTFKEGLTRPHTIQREKERGRERVRVRAVIVA